MPVVTAAVVVVASMTMTVRGFIACVLYVGRAVFLLWMVVSGLGGALCSGVLVAVVLVVLPLRGTFCG